jgi:hypothetical protein
MLANHVAHSDLYITEGTHTSQEVVERSIVIQKLFRTVRVADKVVALPAAVNPTMKHIAKRQTPQQFIILSIAHTSKDEMPKKEGEN